MMRRMTSDNLQTEENGEVTRKWRVRFLTVLIIGGSYWILANLIVVVTNWLTLVFFNESVQISGMVFVIFFIMIIIYVSAKVDIDSIIDLKQK